ncbi:MAG: hypothetical protein JWQ43_1863 [Glaciihabitans sp.]|nr:hypothetical protein [Glaciihabitans sp.]
MPVTLGYLLAQRSLGLRLVCGPESGMDHPILWAHGSDLADPTPFLSPGDALLTTGIQYEANDTTAWTAYVDRLVAAGVPALGFGTEVVREGTPTALVDACASAGIALFEVPYKTPFIAVARAVATFTADERFARSAWALQAQGSIARAALHPDGLGATLAELSHQLGATVGLFNPAGEVSRVAPGTEAGALAALGEDANKLLGAGRRASIRARTPAGAFELQTLGRHGSLRGVLAVGEPTVSDSASAQVIGSVVARVELSLEQNHTTSAVRNQVRSAILEALLAGHLELTQSLSRQLWGPLPATPIHVVLFDAPTDKRPALADNLEMLADKHAGAIFHALRDDQLVVIVESSTAPLVDSLCASFCVRAGVSPGAGYTELATLIAKAQRALDAPSATAGRVRHFTPEPSDQLRGLLQGDDARRIAVSALAPLTEHDRERGAELTRSAMVWLEHNGQFESAATQLGIHRHTLRARISAVEAILQVDLSGFAARATLWNLLAAAPDIAPSTN